MGHSPFPSSRHHHDGPSPGQVVVSCASLIKRHCAHLPQSQRLLIVVGFQLTQPSPALSRLHLVSCDGGALAIGLHPRSCSRHAGLVGMQGLIAGIIFRAVAPSQGPVLTSRGPW